MAECGAYGERLGEPLGIVIAPALMAKGFHDAAACWSCPRSLRSMADRWVVLLGFDTAEQQYAWLVTSILRDWRLNRIPSQAADVPDNE
jgi:hypothetical protein